MKQQKTKAIIAIISVIFSTALIVSCASIGTPTGGPRDYTPPVYKSSNPKMNQTEFNNKKIMLEFDEVIQLDNPSENVIISPPQREMPKIKANLKKIDIELIDSLLPNTSYTIDFGDAIKDNNEGNVLRGFSIAFSTGKSIDSLQISGTVLNAEDLEPVTGMTIGLHPADNDTAFKSIPFIRVTRTDAYGRFSIKNLKKQEYKLYGVIDADRNYIFNAPTEDIAFYNETITPWAEVTSHNDTIFTDTTRTVIDTIETHSVTRFFPDSLFLFSFNEGFKPHYIDKQHRSNRERLSITLSQPSKKVAELTPVNFSPAGEWAILERNISNDTLTFWLKDSLVYNLDTLQVVANYMKTDSLLNLVTANDTLNFIYREGPMKDKSSSEKKSTPTRRGRRAKIDTIEVERAEIEIPIPGTIDIYSSPSIRFEEPIESLDKSKVSLKRKVDSLWVDIKGWDIERDSLSPRKYIVKNRWDFETNYKLVIDSACVYTIYGLTNDSTDMSFKTKKSSEYSNLFVETIGVNSGAFVELLDSKDKPVRYATVRNGGAEFVYVKPGTYYLRLTIDSDNNKKFTTGNFDKRQQPERAYYYPKPIELKPNWDVEQIWNVFEVAIDKQKPYVLIKNKPKDDKNRPQIEEQNEDPIYSNRPSAKF